FNSGLQYSGINSARSALASFLTINNKPVDSNPIVIRFLKGVFNIRPALPRNNLSWDINFVLSYLKMLSPVKKISLKLLTFKLVMLFALLSGSRIQTLQCLDIRNI
ncbi:hypothetical protein LOTGIDRAFT_99085, partial [Lottia gigantea]